MVKIKTKKKMTLPELIKWGWKNGEEQRIFHGSKYGSVCFNDDSWVIIEQAIEPDEIFEVEVEEEIDEDTKIPVLVEVYKCQENHYSSTLEHNTSVSVEKDETSVAFYMLNDDMTMTLLWRNGGMVE